MTKLSFCKCGNESGELELSERNPKVNQNNGREKNNFFKNLKHYLLEYCREGSLHGVKYLGENRTRFEKLFWSFLIIISVVTCGYLIARIYRKYDDSPVIVSLATRESPIFTIPFPAVTICPVTKTDRTKLNYTMVIEKLKNNESLAPEVKLNAHYLSFICDEESHYFSQNETFSDKFFHALDEIKPTFSFPFPCYYRGKTYNCTDLLTPIILDQGICYTFNMLDREEIFNNNVVHYSNFHKNGETNSWNPDEGYSDDSKVDTFPRRAISGADNGFHLLLFQSKQDVDYVCMDELQGYNIILHAPHSIPRLRKEYFRLPFNSIVMTAIQPKMMTTSREVKNYDPIDRECYFTYERPLKYIKIYTPENCRLECLTNYTLQRCGCETVQHLFVETKKKRCMENAETEITELELKYLIDQKQDDDDEDGVFCDCMPLCEQLSYDMEQSQCDWEWEKQFEAVDRLRFEELIKTKKIAKITVFFKQEQFLTSQRNELYGPIDFLANFGGLLGLFIGFSLLSLMEIIYFGTIRIFCNRKLYNVWSGKVEQQENNDI